MDTMGQDLTIRYDFIKDEYRYFHGNKEISQPLIKRNYEVKVVVDNLNPFVFVAKCGWKEEVVQDNASVSGMAGMFKTAGLPTAGLSSFLGELNMDDINTRSGKMVSSFHEDQQYAGAVYNNIESSYKKLYNAEQSLLRITASAARLRQLKYYPYLESDTLKALAEQLVEQSLTIGSTPMDRVYNATAFLDYATMLRNTIDKEYEALKSGAEEYSILYNSYMSTHADFQEKGMDITIKSWEARAKMMKSAYTADLIEKRVNDLEQQYEVIKYTPFEYVCNYMARGDMLSLTLDFFELSQSARAEGYTIGMPNTDTLRKIRTKQMNIIVRGDVKISSSVGLGFPTYFKANQTFSNPDTMIRSVAGNNFAPCISTFINFYPYQGRNAHWGGTFGVGVPVQGDNTGNLNFFLGLSSVLGSNSKVVLNAGLAIGQNQVLDKGQKVGDKLPMNIDPTTKKAFKTGAFFGISFALSK